MNLSALRQYTRELTGVYSSDVISDTLLNRWINESYFKIARQAEWPWTATELYTNTDTPAFDAQFHSVLSYQAAIVSLAFMSDDTNRSEAYSALAGQLITDMITFYLPAAATGDTSSLTSLVRATRDLLGMYNNKALTDEVIITHINRAYGELQRMHDWDWLTLTEDISLPAYDSNTESHNITTLLFNSVGFGFTGDAYIFNTSPPENLVEGNPYLLKQIKEMYIVKPSGEVKEVVHAPNLDRIPKNSSGAYYHMTQAGSLVIKPEQEDGSKIKVRYRINNHTLKLPPEEGQAPKNTPLFDPQFNMILVYRAAVSIIAIYVPDDKRGQNFMDEFTALYSSMYTTYAASHDNHSIQLGSDGISTRVYYPWFKPA